MASEKRAFVPNFEEDVFISYGHTDNQNAWVTAFHKALDIRLQELLGTSDVRIWRDPKLDPLVYLDQVIQHKVTSAAMFVSVLSPRYLNSSSCKKEVGWFLQAASRNGGAKVTERSRIVRVLKTDLQGAPEPEGLQSDSTLGISFFKQQDDDTFREYQPDRELYGYQEFVAEVDRLAQAMNRKLRSMAAERAPSPAEARRTVFLGWVASDLKTTRENVYNELIRRHDVVPDREEVLPPTGAELAQRMESLLVNCDASIHLMGKNYGTIPDGEEHSLIHRQYEIARSFKPKDNRPFQQAVWIPKDLTDPQEMQARFLETIPCDERTEKVQTGVEPFKEWLRDRLPQLPTAGKADAETPERSRSVFLIFDKSDLERGQWKDIRSYLLNQGYPCDIPTFQADDPGEIRKLEESLICEHFATLIYYGNATDTWVASKRRTIRSVLAQAQAGRKHARAVYLCVPEDDFKKANFVQLPARLIPEGPGFNPLLVMGDCGEFKPEKLAPLVQRLEEIEP